MFSVRLNPSHPTVIASHSEAILVLGLPTTHASLVAKGQGRDIIQAFRNDGGIRFVIREKFVIL